jgi:hypothetical protein
MAGSGQVAESLARRYAVLRPHLDERQRRLLLGTEAAELGRGGIKAVAAATGVHPDTVARGLREIEGHPEPQQRVRAAGGGRKKLSQTNPALAAQLQALVDPQTRGDPMLLLVWTMKSTKNLAAALTSSGHPVWTGRWPGCCRHWGSACRATPRSSKVVSMPPRRAVPLSGRAGS